MGLREDNDPELYFAEDGAPRSGRFGDIYYSLQDGLSESRAVFLTGCHLPEAWKDKHRFTVLELGFGTGLNIAALMQVWVQNRPIGGHLHVVSIEGFLMEPSQARQALANWPELAPFTEALLEQWPQARKGRHYMDFAHWGISICLSLCEVMPALEAWEGCADAVFLDGFSPSLNPDMWAEEVLALLAQKCVSGTRLASFTVAGFVRRGLQAQGFKVEKCPGFGRKRERLEAIFEGAHQTKPSMRRGGRIAVVGAGIAGCALVYQARLLGIETDLFEVDAPGSGASGNLAALVTPRLDAGDNEISALFADAFTYAREHYRRLCPEGILGTGVFQAEAIERDADRFARIQKQTVFSPTDLSLYEKGDLPEMPDRKGICLNSALWVTPKDILTALREEQEPITAHVVAIDKKDDVFSVITKTDQQFSGYDAVILACGDGIFDLFDYQERYDLRSVRGQVEIATSELPLKHAISWGGYAIPLSTGFIFGATHERQDRGTEMREADRVRNLESLRLALPAHAGALCPGAVTSRASVRVMTRDYLPVVGATSDGIYLLSGLGARGFCLAPLLAKAVLYDLLGIASPLMIKAKHLLRPERLSGKL